MGTVSISVAIATTLFRTLPWVHGPTSGMSKCTHSTLDGHYCNGRKLEMVTLLI